jgi:hypothetical protein
METTIQLPQITKEMFPKLTQLVKLRKKLPKKKVAFSYIKDDGTLRHAIGTTNPDLMPKDKRPKGTSKRKPHPELINYYDFHSNSWASFRPCNFQEKI